MPLVNRHFLIRGLLVVALLALVGIAAAQSLPVPQLTVGVNGGGKTGDVSSSLQILALLTVLSLAPAILMLTTAFTRIVIILSFLRQALGTPTIPPNQVVIGLSLFLTFFVMAPTYNQINHDALTPLSKGQITTERAIELASGPMKEFMLKQTYEKDLVLFMNIRHETAQTKK